MADIKYTVVFDSKAAAEAAVKLDQAVGGLGKQATVAKPPFAGLWKEVFGGIAIADLAKRAVKEFTDFIKDSVKAAMEAEKANAALKSALGATGREVDANAKHFIDYASSLQKSTIYNDEAIKGAQALLLQLTTLDRDGIDRATRGAIGLSSVLGVDLQSAAMMVTKAMEGNTAALGRYGIKVKETGTAEEKRNELLEKLEGFYKRATDATDTFAGKQAQLKNNLDEFKETVGKAIIENKTLQKTVDDLSLSFQYLAEHGEVLKKSLDVAFSALMGPGLMVILKLLGLLADKQREINRQNEEGAKWAGEFNKQLIAIGKSGTDLSGSPLLKFFVDLNKETKEGSLAFKVTDEWAKKFGITLRSTVIEQINETKEALKRLKASGEATPGAIEGLNKKLKDLENYLVKAKTAAASCGAKLRSELVPEARNLNDVFAHFPVVVDQAYVKSTVSLGQWAKAHKDQIEGVTAFAQQTLGLLQSIYSSYYANRMTEIDNDYQKRKEAIENSLMSEEEKAVALEGLDKEYNEKKKKLQKEAAEKQKALSIIQAVINTAEAVTKAWSLGPIIGPIMAAVAAAMGAVQIALIKKQTIPLGRGALFDRPTLLAGGRYEVGEAGKEAVMPVEPLMRDIRSAITEGMRGLGGTPIINVYIGGEKLDERAVKAVERRSKLGRPFIHSRAVN